MGAAVRLFAWFFFLLGVLAVVTDVTRSLAAHTTVITSLLEHWSKLAPVSLASVQAGARRVPFLWDHALRPLLSLPAWGFALVLAAGLGYLGRRRRAVNVFAN